MYRNRANPEGILTRRQRPVVIADVSDIHAGGTTALCPERIALDDGGEYVASKLQRWLFQCWEDYWRQVQDYRKRHNADLYVVFNGDLIEGDHHKTTQIVSANPNAQAAVVNAVMAVPLALKPDRLIFVRGTEVHVGQSASAEERIADGLRRDKRPVVTDSESGTASWWHWRAEIQGVRIDATHHGRSGFREHTRGGAAVLYAHDILAAHVKDGDPYPHLCLRAHHHKFNDSYDACPVRVHTTGAWQLSTGFGHRIAADSLPDIGGSVVLIQDGQYELKKIEYKPTRGPTWRPQ